MLLGHYNDVFAYPDTYASVPACGQAGKISAWPVLSVTCLSAAGGVEGTETSFVVGICSLCNRK
jgi:hypothetical protein